MIYGLQSLLTLNISKLYNQPKERKHGSEKEYKRIESLPQTLIFEFLICATQCRRPQIFQIENYVILNSLCLKYQKFTPLGCEDIGFGKFSFFAFIPLVNNLDVLLCTFLIIYI